jgi:inorganic pyrophosphatase
MNFKLPPVDPETGLFNVVIETPRGSSSKFAYEQKFRGFLLKYTLPPGLTFPADFGFIPKTLAADGDPIDVLVVHPAVSVPGIVTHAKLIGVIEVIQGDDKKSAVRNDRLIAVGETDPRFKEIRSLSDLPKEFPSALEDFFKISNKFEGKYFEFLKFASSGAAKKLVEKAKANRKQRKR